MKRFEEFARFMLNVGKLKKIKRTGWILGGIESAESDADHSFRVAIMALVLAEKCGADQNRSVKMALIHELAESIVGDLTPFDGVTLEEKHRLEIDAFRKICEDIENGDELIELFLEYLERKTPEARFVKRLDKLEMMFQAHEYGIDHPRANLLDFWIRVQGYDFGALQDIFDGLEATHSR